MLNRRPSAIAYGLLIAAVLVGMALHAESGASQDLQTGWYVVRFGDTLEGITARYFGTSLRWKENWKLNPDLEDPHMIRPGTRLRILIPLQEVVGGAILTKVSREVDEQPAPFPWTDAQEWDLLKARDSIRTHENSSAELMFGDERLVLTEDSLVILGHEKETKKTSAAAAPGAVDVVVGQVDLQAPAVSENTDHVEILVGEVSMLPKRSSDEDLWTRARKPSSGGAQLMVFSGESEVSAGGEKVTVGRGMGTSVADKGKPSQPEALLAAPEILQPEAGSSWSASNPLFRWAEVDGAMSYVLEVCGDRQCGRIEERAVGIKALEWRPEALATGSFYWRLTAVASSGLDGFPSPARELSITSAKGDDQPPQARVLIKGPSIGMGDRLVVGPGFELSSEVSDDGAGMQRWIGVLDGQELDPGTWPTSLEKGSHTVAILATDRAGNETRSDATSFVFDPEPPEIAWGWSKDSILDSARGERLAPDAGVGQRSPSTLLWSGVGGRWRTMGNRSWTIRSDTPGFWVRPKKGSLLLSGIDEPITADRPLGIRALDEHCGISKLTFAVETRAEGSDSEAVYLVVEATDNVGNSSRVEWLASSRR